MRRLRSDGWAYVERVEHWNAHTKHRVDLLGCVDVLALGKHVLGVQATSESNAASRVRKIAALPHFGAIMDSGINLEVWGWRKVGRSWVVRRRMMVSSGGEVWLDD